MAEKLFRIETEKIVNGTNMFRNMPIVSFSGDLSSLVTGNSMFSDSQLEHFDWKGGNDLISNVLDIDNSANMFDGCYLNSTAVENIYDMLSKTTNTSVNANSEFIISINANNSGARNAINEKFGVYINYDWETDTYSNTTQSVTLPNGVKFNLTVKVDKKKDANEVTYGDGMFYGFDGTLYDDYVRLVVDFGQTNKLISGYRMFYDAGNSSWETPTNTRLVLGEVGVDFVLEVKGNFANLVDAEEMFAVSNDYHWVGTLGGAMGVQSCEHLHLDIDRFTESNPCKITKLTNIVNGRNIDSVITYEALFNIAKNSICPEDDYMGYIFTGSTPWEQFDDVTWGDVTGIRISSTESQIRDILEGYGWTVKSCEYVKLKMDDNPYNDWGWGSNLFTVSTTNLLGNEITLGIFTPYGATVPCECWEGDELFYNGM